MALARASRIQDKLNSNELKSDWPIWKHATPVLSCFRRALEIDSSNLSLWIEYGTMSYALHAFASRQLKQWRGDLPSELVQQVRRGLEALLRHTGSPSVEQGWGLLRSAPSSGKWVERGWAALLDPRARHSQCYGAGSWCASSPALRPTLARRGNRASLPAGALLRTAAKVSRPPWASCSDGGSHAAPAPAVVPSQARPRCTTEVVVGTFRRCPRTSEMHKLFDMMLQGRREEGHGVGLRRPGCPSSAVA